MKKELLALDTDEFHMRFYGIATDGGLHAILGRSDEIADIREALSQGTLTGADIEAYVGNLMVRFQSGFGFEGDLQTAAIAVALEHCETEFAEEYLQKLGDLHISEMWQGPHVARYCLKKRNEQRDE